MLLRRAALDEVGAFDPAFFLFNEEVDLCLRLAAAGWHLAVAPESTFVHVGGVATRPRWKAAYREQLRGHLRLLDKHEGRRAAEQARRFLAATLAVRALLASQEQRRLLQEYARWLRGATVAELLEEQPAVRNGAVAR
jgi:GT2 family glycosyltransferase